MDLKKRLESVEEMGISLKSTPGMTDEDIYIANYGAIQRKYPGECSAILDGHIVGHHLIYDRLVKSLIDRKIFGAYIGRPFVEQKPQPQFARAN